MNDGISESHAIAYKALVNVAADTLYALFLMERAESEITSFVDTFELPDGWEINVSISKR